MARTNDPHPRGFLKFACLVRARVRDAHRICPPAYPASVLREILPAKTPGDAAYVDYLAGRADRYVAFLSECERERLLADGWASDEIDTPRMRRSIERVVAHECLRDLREFELAKLKSPKQFAIETGAEPDGRFPREIVVEAIVGTHLALGAGWRSGTSKAINRGIPTKDRGYTPTPTEVRSAVDSFVGSHLMCLANKDMRAPRFAAWNALVVDAIWKRIQADPYLRSLPCADAMAVLDADGRFWTWLREEEERHDVPEITHARRLELFNHAVKIGRRVLARKERHLSAGGKTVEDGASLSHAPAI